MSAPPPIPKRPARIPVTRPPATTNVASSAISPIGTPNINKSPGSGRARVHKWRVAHAQKRKRVAQRCNPRPRLDRLGREMAAKRSRTRHASKQSKHVTRDGVEARTTRKLALDVGNQRLCHGLRRDKLGRHSEKNGIHVEQPPGLLVGGPSHHHPVDPCKGRSRLNKVGDPAVEHNSEARMR